ncbi:saccharopine dehydrogenase-like oxidoreductase [Paramacrobiotus metropolitanus]|uniref:saccharopine dehydrogenase-like oxidoreductase n=1 Tax=Paramacrobiotus metropolitanus TaxID=2943436 RepID=UPI002445BD3D|nr:saccharopine dehydrogenase-like oxidoreductase [Paramacrobiotus metropolitanus]
MDGDRGRSVDAVIFGATGFTGERVVRAAIRKQKQEPGFTFAIAGRSVDKLRQVLNRCKQISGLGEFEVKLIEADVSRPESILEMCRQGKVVINCVGPYRFYGEQVVKACVDAGTHYVDISGEPQFLESMQLRYDQQAREKGIYIVGACGFDSIPSEMGVAFTKKHFDGDLNSIETFLSFKAGPEGTSAHYATWESAVHGISAAAELSPIRKQLFAQRLPRPTHKVEEKKVFYNEDVRGWAIPFPGADRSIARRTEYLEFTEQNHRPVQVISYLKTGSIINTAQIVIFGALFMFMAKFKFTRDLLLKYPKVFSMGFFSHEGPTEEQMRNTSFRMEIVGRGYSQKLSSPDEVHTAVPDKRIVAEVTGPDPGYNATSAMVLESAMTILEESGQPKSRIPRFGVLPPGYAFENTGLIGRLHDHGIGFKVISKDA